MLFKGRCFWYPNFRAKTSKFDVTVSDVLSGVTLHEFTSGFFMGSLYSIFSICEVFC